MNAAPIALGVADAATAVGVSPKTIRRAIHSTDPTEFPPPLRAKRAGSERKPKYLITVAELTRWVESLPDA